MVADKCCCLAGEYNLYPQRRRPGCSNRNLLFFTELCLALLEAVSLAGSHGNRSMLFLELFVRDFSALSISMMGRDGRRM